MTSLAKRVRDCRYAKGWGPDELAGRAEISRTALYQIESGKTELPRAGTLRRIARALDVSIDVLLGNADIGTFQLATFAQGATAARGSRPSQWTKAEQDAYGVFPGDPEPEPVPVEPQTATSDDQELTHAPRKSANLLDRERDLNQKLHELLASPLGDGIARILDDTYQLLPIVRSR